MTNPQIIDQLRLYFKKHTNTTCKTVIPIEQSGSARKYYRLLADGISLIGVYNNNKPENQAFLKFTKHFQTKDFNVPNIHIFDEINGFFIIEDLGNTTLFELLNNRQEQSLNNEHKEYLQQVIKDLIRFQITGNKGFEYDYCYPIKNFEKQSILWDLNYFKYYFLKLVNIDFNESKLENDFQRFADYIFSTPADFFMYRDFQSRNIMVNNEQLYYIDYQGGRKGPLQYDLVSLLYQARLNLTENDRTELLNYYINKLATNTKEDTNLFKEKYYAFALLRTLQVLGAYGYRGLFEKKSHFIQSIPFAIKNLQSLISKDYFKDNWNYLTDICKKVTDSYSDNISLQATKKDILILRIISFSYKKGIPEDYSGNGGGFVFDCRVLPNPGREEKYKSLTGKHADVINYLEEKEEVQDFVKSVFAIADNAVSNYVSRKFSNLMFSFGCTGGQHRSVYNAEKLAKYIKAKYPIEVILKHREIE